MVAITKRVGWACLGSLLASLAWAQTASPPASSETPFSFSTKAVIRIDANHKADFEYVFRGKVLNSSGVQALGAYRDTYNAHFTAIEVLEGYTQKPDGRKIEIDRSKIIEQSASVSPDALHFYVDLRTITVIFPQVEIGDEVVAVIRHKSLKAYLEGGHSAGYIFPRHVRRSGAEFEFRVPKNLPFVAEFPGVEAVGSFSEGEHNIHRFAYRGAAFEAPQADALHPFLSEPSLSISTFPDWNAVGRAFWERGAPMAKPSPAIAEKAREITKGLEDNRAKAEAVFNWVSSKVRYVNIVLGSGGWVPRQADSVLQNLFGDCKDHVTLMRAMLETLGIASEYVLVNAGGNYKASNIPLAYFDHIILYLPEFQLYIDPTVSTAQFGETEMRLQGKPVLHITGEGSRYTRIPTLKPEQNDWVLTAQVTIAADGTASGHSELLARHSGLTFARLLSTQLANGGLETTATRRLTQANWRGKAAFAVEPRENRKPETRIRAEFQISGNLLQSGQSGTRLPIGPLPTARPTTRLGMLVRDGASRPFSCAPVRWSEQLTIRWPGSAKLARLPENVNVRRGPVSYLAEYQAADSSVIVRRQFVWNHPELACDMRSIATYRPVLMAARRDLNGARLHFEGANTGNAADADKDPE
jgi:hypothetical protein